MTFLAPAIVVMNSFFGATWSGMAMIDDLDHKVVERFLATPASRFALVLSQIVRCPRFTAGEEDIDSRNSHRQRRQHVTTTLTDEQIRSDIYAEVEEDDETDADGTDGDDSDGDDTDGDSDGTDGGDSDGTDGDSDGTDAG